jgi:hypothetical protein
LIEGFLFCAINFYERMADMQTSTLPELIQREGIPDHVAIFSFRKENGRGVIEFDLPPVKEAAPKEVPPMSAAEALQRLQALQFDTGRPTNSVKIIRALRRARYPRRSKSRAQQGRKR